MPTMKLEEYGLCHYCKHSARSHYSAGVLEDCDIFECDCRKYVSLDPRKTVPADDPLVTKLCECEHPLSEHGVGSSSRCRNESCSCKGFTMMAPAVPASDPVNHPHHYASAYKGLEIIDLTEQMNFNRGNVVKYVSRAGIKDPETEIQDLEKARWYLTREIERVKKEKKG